MVDDIVIVTGLPTVVHVEPSAETALVNTLPTRVRRTHSGGVAEGPDADPTVPPVEVRVRKRVPPPATSAVRAKLEFASSVSRRITPARAPGAVPRPATRAVISPSPLSGCDVKLNWSEVPAKPAPAPFSVKAPPASTPLPAKAGAPTSSFTQGAGSVLDGGTTVSVAVLLVAEPAELVTMQRYVQPLIASVVAGVVYDADVAPEMLALFFCH